MRSFTAHPFLRTRTRPRRRSPPIRKCARPTPARRRPSSRTFRSASFSPARMQRRRSARCRAFITKFPQSALLPAAIFTLGGAQNASGQKDAALATFKDLAAKFPKSPPAPYAYFERAKILNGNQKFDDCLAVMRDFIKSYPDSDKLYLAYDFVAQIHTSQSKGAEAIATYDEFVEKRPKDPAAASALLKLSTLWKAYTDSQGPYLAIEEAKRAEWRKSVEKRRRRRRARARGFPRQPRGRARAEKPARPAAASAEAAKLRTEADVEKYFEDLAAKFAKPTLAPRPRSSSRSPPSPSRKTRPRPCSRWAAPTSPTSNSRPRI